jgi:hypothetical protein
MPLGPHTITVLVTNGFHRWTQTLSVTGRDAAPPHMQVSVPSAGANILGDTTGAATVHLAGTTFDTQGGMVGGAAAVECASTPTGPGPRRRR